jgi:hypothetical protein
MTQPGLTIKGITGSLLKYDFPIRHSMSLPQHVSAYVRQHTTGPNTPPHTNSRITKSANRLAGPTDSPGLYQATASVSSATTASQTSPNRDPRPVCFRHGINGHCPHAITAPRPTDSRPPPASDRTQLAQPAAATLQTQSRPSLI